MSQTYTEAFAIGSGSSLGCMAIHNSTGSLITATVVPFRNSGNGSQSPVGATCAIAVAAGDILPLKVREIRTTRAPGLIGFN
jgi:hypothetical protein